MPIDYRELGFTRPGAYIYELLADLNITDKTATMLIDIIEQAALLLEEGKLQLSLCWDVNISANWANFYPYLNK